MADRLWRAQVSIPNDSGLAEDAIVNTFYFDDDDDGLQSEADTRDDIVALLTAFYNGFDVELLAGTFDVGTTIRMYDMRDPEPRVPLFTEELVNFAGATAAFPQEVALCCSFSADVASGQLPARRRGRVYLGPVNSGAGEVVAGHNRPTAAVRTAVANAAAIMAAGRQHASSSSRCRWAIFSPTTLATVPGATIDDAFHDVTHGWVDNAWDIQRRRGNAPSARTLWAPA